MVKKFGCTEIDQRKDQLGARFNQHSWFLVRPSFALRGIYYFVTAEIRPGECWIYNSKDGISKTLTRYDVKHISALPSVLKRTFDALPDDIVKLDDLTISAFGGGIGETQRAGATHDLAKTLFEKCSSNESEPACIVEPNGVGKILPGIEVETADDHHHPV